ncbi:hypothetical protein ACFO8O_07260 [Hephaestia sp. GCM10023244]|uniref:hypothetical protein n=1 Tax=unclassified Hephaestia TaxID=2631281 RepID=UPI00207723CC|nr:hypothetical protein [Hephaestia sp. MAHUQ-44]MCM8730764.1 hypothetical protein [Hephaestia sp. MAHUQ-44]
MGADRGCPPYPNDGWTLPMAFADIPAGTRDALLRQAGFHGAGTAWKGCDGMSDVSFADSMVQDLNGDGRAEVIVIDQGTGCYGMTGTGFRIFAATPGGWTLMDENSGIPTFLPGKGAGNFPDIEVGGPGFCFPVERWNGTHYAIVGYAYDGKACTPP